MTHTRTYKPPTRCERSILTEAGFTLVEILIALFIFAMISAGTLSVLTNTLSAKDQMDDRLAHVQSVDTARALIKSDMANIVLRETRDAYGTKTPYRLSGGVETLISFTRTGRINPGGLEPRGDMQRISYAFEDGQLIRRSLAHVNPAPQTPSIDRVLIDDLASVSINFLSRSGSSSTALLQPSTQIFLTANAPAPQAIALELVFKNDNRLTQIFELAL